MNLSVDWAEFREKNNLNRINDVWMVSPKDRSMLLSELTNLESEAALHSPFHPAIDSIFKHSILGILSNNSEEAIKIMLSRYEAKHKTKIASIRIIGRETLQGPKESKPLFENAIFELLAPYYMLDLKNCYYIGDAGYELDYASQLGLKTIKVTSSTSNIDLN
jgi:hypothetical protein